MKHSFLYLLLLTIVPLLSSCKPGNVPDVPSVKWSLSDNINPLISMTLTTGYPADFESSASKEDKVAVFRDSICVGVASPEETSLGTRFFVLIYGAESNEELSRELIIRFYSKEHRRIFHASESIIFASDTQVGTVSDPKLFTWIQD